MSLPWAVEMGRSAGLWVVCMWVCTHSYSSFLGRHHFSAFLFPEKPCGWTHKWGTKVMGKRLELAPYKKTPLESAIWGSCWKSNICLGSLSFEQAARADVALHCTGFHRASLVLKVCVWQSSQQCHLSPWLPACNSTGNDFLSFFLLPLLIAWCYPVILWHVLDPPKPVWDKLFRMSHI